MQQVPDIVPADEADLEGHLWIFEAIDGPPFRFSVAASGLISFGDATHHFGPVNDVPLPYRAAAREIQTALDRQALQQAASEPSRVTFCGVATRRERIAYDWDRIPAFLGTDIWSPTRGTYLPPDAVKRIYDRLGPTPVHPLEKEVRVANVNLTEFSMSTSRWYDGQAAGVIFRDKTGGRGQLSNPAIPNRPDTVQAGPDELVDRFVTTERLEQTVRTLADEDRVATVDTVLERTLESIAREKYSLLYRNEDPAVDLEGFKSTAAERIGRWLG